MLKYVGHDHEVGLCVTELRQRADMLDPGRKITVGYITYDPTTNRDARKELPFITAKVDCAVQL